MSVPAASQTAPTFVVPPGRRLPHLWPEPRPEARPGLLVSAVLVGLVGTVVLPEHALGIGTFASYAALAGVVTAADPRRSSLRHLAGLGLCTALVSTVFLLDAAWVVALCVLAAAAVGVTALVDARTLAGMVGSAAVVPLAGLRGLRWLRRSATRLGPARVTDWLPVARTLLVSLVLVLVFGLLFSSADAVFSTWAGALVPDLAVEGLVEHVFVLAVVAALTLATAYVALNPPPVDQLAPPAGKPVRRAFEWLVPVGLVTALFVAFVAAQATVLFGGHDYLRRTTGLTYATYVHQGFAQLTVATALTLAVIGIAARRAPRGSGRERLLLRLVLGALCLLSLVVVASALHRMSLYTDAYGLTRLRVLVSVFEGWLGLLVVLVMVAGIRLRGSWLPVAAVHSGAVVLLALAVANPDARIAAANVERAERTGKVDVAYLRGLSADATPGLAGWAGFDACRWTDGRAHTGLSWNLSRTRAAAGCAKTGAAPGGND